nr:hypothetical protein [Tanacetum cinerariifolium]
MDVGDDECDNASNEVMSEVCKKEWIYNENELYSDVEEGEIQPEYPSEPFIEDLEKVTGKHSMPMPRRI